MATVSIQKSSVVYVTSISRGPGTSYTVPTGCYAVITAIGNSISINGTAMTPPTSGGTISGIFVGEGSVITVPGGGGLVVGAVFTNS